jgi:hypothetical protein
MHLPPHGVPELVRAGVTGFYVQRTDTGPLLETITPGADPSTGTSTIVDPVTLEDLFTPIENDPSACRPIAAGYSWITAQARGSRSSTE